MNLRIEDGGVDILLPVVRPMKDPNNSPNILDTYTS